jgi:peroxiredoxin
MTLKRSIATLMVVVTATVGPCADAHAAVGQPAPPFTLPAAPGGPTRTPFRLAAHLGVRPVVVLYWATWSVPDVNVLAFYRDVFARYRGAVAVVGVAVDEGSSVADVGPVARRLGVTFDVVTDPGAAITRGYNPRRETPFGVWIDGRGVIQRERNEIVAGAAGAETERELANLVAGRPVH